MLVKIINFSTLPRLNTSLEQISGKLFISFKMDKNFFKEFAQL